MSVKGISIVASFSGALGAQLVRNHVIQKESMMTAQEVLYKGQWVWVKGIESKSGKLHVHLKKYVGRKALVLCESKNNQLLLDFKTHTRAIPAGCVCFVQESHVVDPRK